MSTLHHAIKINASPAHIYKALTQPSQMASWHLGTVEGEIAVGATLTLTPRPGVCFAWRTEALEADRSITQTCIHGSGTSAGKRLTFELSDAGAGLTTVRLTDGDWAEDDPHMAFCNSHWGDVLNRLKHHVEQR